MENMLFKGARIEFKRGKSNKRDDIGALDLMEGLSSDIKSQLAGNNGRRSS
jgi:hypothetical protein